MVQWSTILRLSLGLAFLTVSIVAAAASLGLVEEGNHVLLEKRSLVGEMLALRCAGPIERADYARLQQTLNERGVQNPEIASAAVRTAEGRLVASYGEHEGNWKPSTSKEATSTQMQFRLARDGAPWGAIEVRFHEPRGQGMSGWFGNRFYSLLVFVALASIAAFSIYLYFILRKASRSEQGAVPQRVRTALDALTEGVIILDGQKRIALANESFGKLLGTTPEELRGRTIDGLPWIRSATEHTALDFPWERAREDLSVQRGSMLAMQLDEQRQRLVAVNAAPILDDSGHCRGAMATFDDLTSVEKKNSRLMHLLKMLRESREDIRKQNDHLRILATRDPLTGCLNRRAFFEEFDKLLNAATRHGLPLSCVMVDVDFFKRINDTHGHAAGDKVLEAVGITLRTSIRASDLVCRYGGEEFAVLLSHIDLEGAMQFAERMRKSIAESTPSGIAITASLGVSSLSFGARTAGEMIDQADKALYAAKRGGRNRAISWDHVPPGMAEEKSGHNPVAEPVRTDESISSHTVNVLFSALMLRHPATAEHAQRVAKLAVALADGRLSHGEIRILEVASMLREVGIISLPDSILNKKVPLDEADWALIRTHRACGLEIVREAFACEHLNEILRTYPHWFGGHPAYAGACRGEEIPLAARILALAEAYVSLTTDVPFGRGLQAEPALAELAINSGTQFDPSLLGPLQAVVRAQSPSNRPSDATASPNAILRVGSLLEHLSAAVDAGDRRTVAAKVIEVQEASEAARLRTVSEAAKDFAESLARKTGWDEVVECMLTLGHTYSTEANLDRSDSKAKVLASHDVPEVCDRTSSLSGMPNS